MYLYIILIKLNKFEYGFIMKDKKKNKNLKYAFDKISSNHAQDWQLALFWIIMFELFASVFEYLFLTNSQTYVNILPPSIFKEFIIGTIIAFFIWACVYNFIFWNKTNFLLLILFSCTGIYFMITNDLTLEFLLHNIEPSHFFQMGMSSALIVELLFKVIITYLIYQLVMSIRYLKLQPL